MELKQMPKIEKFLFTIKLDRHLDDGNIEPTGLNIKLQISPNRRDDDMYTDIIRTLLSAIESVSSQAILTNNPPDYRHPLMDL